MSITRHRPISYAKGIKKAIMAGAAAGLGYIGKEAIRGAGRSANEQAYAMTQNITPALTNVAQSVAGSVRSTMSSLSNPFARSARSSVRHTGEGHTRYSQMRTRKRKRRYRAGKTKYGRATKKLQRRVRPMVKRIVRKECSHIPGPKMTIQFHQKYCMFPDASVSEIGACDANADEFGHVFIPMFTDGQMSAEFKLGETRGTENVTGEGFNRAGILDPPNLRDYVLGQEVTNQVKDKELIKIDSMVVTLYITNTQDTKCNLWLQEYVCNDSTDVPFPTRVHRLYSDQPFLSTGTAEAEIPGYPEIVETSSSNLWKQPGFSVSKVTGVAKYWKKGSFKGFVELKPGESYHVKIPYKNISWDRAKFYQENESLNGRYEYHKNISRFIHIGVRGNTGRDSETDVAHFQKCGVSWQIMKLMTAHRVDIFKPVKKQFLAFPYANNAANTKTLIPFGGAFVNEKLESTVGDIESFVPDILQTS